MFDEADTGLLPMLVLAVTVKVYAVPLVSPAITHVVAGAVAMQLPPPDDAVTV